LRREGIAAIRSESHILAVYNYTIKGSGALFAAIGESETCMRL